MSKGHAIVRVLVSCACLIYPVIAENSYLFISPKTIRPGNDLTIQGSLLAAPMMPVTVTAFLEKSTEPQGRPFFMRGDAQSTTPAPPSEPYSMVRATFYDTQPQTFALPVPHDLPDQRYQLRIQGIGGLQFENETQLEYSSKTHSIFVQTDKAIYKPGQTVHFRVFAVDPELKVLFGHLEVDLYDPAGNKINQWKVAEKELREAAGVFETEMAMSDSPVLGDWKLSTKLGKEKMDKTFTVDEYVLPKFEASIDLPSFGRLKDREFEGSVSAKYTYGKPVKGIADVRIRSKWPQYNWINNTRVRVNKDVELQFPINGNATFTIPTSQLKQTNKYLDYSYLVFEANVTETLTGAKMKAPEEELQFFEQSTKLEFPSSLPSTFKPGLSYTAVLKVSEQDGTAPTMIKGPVKVNITYIKPITLTTTTTTTTPPTPPPEPIMIDGQLVFPVIEPKIMPVLVPHWQWPREEETKQPEITMTLPSDGILEIPLNVPSGITRVSIQASYDGLSAYRSLNQAKSPSESYLQLRLLNDKPKTGDIIGIQIRSTDPTQRQADYQVMSKGNIVMSGRVSLINGVLSFPVTANMAPKARVMVYYVRGDGEVVADGLSFNIEGIFENEVRIGFDKATAQPANQIKLSVSADPGSKINVLAVDKSVLLLKSGNDISHDQVKSELQSYDTADRFGGCDWLCWRWPMPARGDDAKDIFNNAGLAYITDALIYEHKEQWRGGPMPMMAGGFGGGRMAFAADANPRMMMRKTPMAGPPSVDQLKTPKRTRTLFPETWLWQTGNIAGNGTAVFESTVPDTITSWVATAFAVHPETGLGLSEAAATLKTFMPFFVSLHLPYSVVRGEKVILQANVFNYSPFPVFAYVLLKMNPDFDNIHISSLYTSQYSADVARFVMIQPNSPTAVYFPIVPKNVGKIKLNVEARSLYAADAVEKRLIVEPEGTPEEYNVPVLIDLKQTPSFTTTVPVSFPPTTVPGSQRVRVTAIGDLMGPSINGLDSLIKMPYGCGEQNMLNFAPNIFITRYLEITNNLDQALFDKSKNYMKKGYQREMTYQHKDGSFSAFGERDPSGSMWLSAFVLKSFVQAKPYIFIDDKAIEKTVDWIIKHQNSNGTFREPGKVLHKEMQGGSTAGERSLTAFVLVALLEARVVEGVNAKISEAVALATNYLEREVSSMTDVYELAITSYALNLAGSLQAPLAMDRLQALATTEAGMKYWKKAATPVDTTHNPWGKKSNKAINVELSAYGLLALATVNNRDDGLQVLKYLTSQRNPSGGFASTQDTIVALQALAEMASMVYSRDFNANIRVAGPPESFISETFQVTPNNALVLQSRELPVDIGSVSISATGTGMALVEVGVFYNIDRDDEPPSFDLKITLPEEAINHFVVQTCTSYLKEGASSMAVMEIGFPSGFSADKTSIEPHPLLKRVEDGDRKVILYLDEIGKTEICFKILMERVGLVAGAQPVPVKVYDYYEPADHVTSFYVPEALRKSDVCDVCGKECDFCRKQRPSRWQGLRG